MVYGNTGVMKKSTALLLAADVSGARGRHGVLEGRVARQIVQKGAFISLINCILSAITTSTTPTLATPL